MTDHLTGDTNDSVDERVLEYKRAIEAIVLVAHDPVPAELLAQLLEAPTAMVEQWCEELATAYHKFYDVCRVLPGADAELEPINVARLWLCGAARQTLANGLAILGVSAPERM